MPDPSDACFVPPLLSVAVQTLPDYVLATTILKYDGTQVDLKRADDPKGFAVKVLHFGLLGVTVGKPVCRGCDSKVGLERVLHSIKCAQRTC